jgi:hypothetical protein
LSYLSSLGYEKEGSSNLEIFVFVYL